MGESLSAKWKGATETNVINGIGAYHTKTNTLDGYVLRFDYSYDMVSKLSKEQPVRATASVGSRDAKGNPVLVPRNNPQTTVNNPRYNADKVVRYMDFYFDKSGKVDHVMAEGYPDSVYYIKHK